MKLIRHALFIATLAIMLVNCGGSHESVSSSSVSVSGAAVKGPLINASVNAYALDTNRNDLKGELVAIGMTNARAELELEIAEQHLSNTAFIIEYTGGTEINSTLPAIDTLLTLITAEQLSAGIAAYATPLSTFAIQYARKIADTAGVNGDALTSGLIGDGNNTISMEEFFSAIDKAEDLIRATLGLGILNNQVDLFTTPPIIDVNIDAQNALALRTANEVFAAIVSELEQEIERAGGSITGNTVIERLADDFTDGNFDRKNGAAAITEFNDIADISAIFSQNPATLIVPGTQQTIADLPQIMLDELSEIGIATNNNMELPQLPAPIVAPITSVDGNLPDPVIEPEPEPEPPNTAPSVNFITPSNGTVITEGNNLSVALTATDSDGSITYCDLRFDGNLVNRDSAAPYAFNGGSLNNIAAGNHTLSANCVDNQGLSSPVRQISFSANAIPPAPDPVAPTVNFAMPATNTVLDAGDNITALLNANDSDGQIAYCDLSLNGTLVRRDSSSPFSYGASDAALNNLTPGSHTLTALCADNTGLTASASRSFTVNAIPVAPTVNFASPGANHQLDEGGSVNVTLNASDSDGSIAYCDLRINGSLVRRDTNSPYTFGAGDAALNNIPTGNYTLSATCADDDGLTDTADRSFVVNALPTAPVVSFASPGANHQLDEGGSINVSVNASDSDGSIAYCELSLNGSLVRRDTNSPYTFGAGDAALNNISAGNYTLNATCADDDGLTDSVNRSFVVNALPDPVAPSVSFSSPANNTELAFGEALAVALTATDTDGSISHCDLLLNGQLVRSDNSAPFNFGAGSGHADAVLSTLAPGSHTLSASCVDDTNLSASTTISLQVLDEPQTASVMLDWVTPTTREDGSNLPVSEIDSYELLYYPAGNINASVTISVAADDGNGGLVTSYTVPDLSSGSYEFSIATIDTEGNVSQFADPVTLIIP